MPRNPALKYTSAHPRDTGSFVPYLSDFVDLLECSETPIRTSDLVSSYLSYIRTRTEYRCNENQAKSGFNRAFKKIATVRKIDSCTSPRGYYVKLPRLLRHTTPQSENIRVISAELLIKKIFIDKGKGFGVFAQCNLPKDHILVEYKGQWIPKYEYKTREMFYESENLPPVAVFDKNKYLDGNRDINGTLFKKEENTARFFNHSKHSPNCKLIGQIDEFGVKRLFLQTKFSVPNGMELVWDYGERKREITLENPWLMH